MRTIRRPLALGLAALIATLLAGCFAPLVPGSDATDPDAVEMERPDPSLAFAGTSWRAGGTEATQGCEEAVALLSGGYDDTPNSLSHAIRCPGETTWQTYNGHDSQSYWTFDGTTMTFSYNEGDLVCAGPATLELLDLTCVNQAQDEYPREFVPSP